MSRNVPLPANAAAIANTPPTARSLTGPAALTARREPRAGRVDEDVRDDQEELQPRPVDAAPVGGEQQTVRELVERDDHEAADQEDEAAETDLLRDDERRPVAAEDEVGES